MYVLIIGLFGISLIHATFHLNTSRPEVTGEGCCRVDVAKRLLDVYTSHCITICSLKGVHIILKSAEPRLGNDH